MRIGPQKVQALLGETHFAQLPGQPFRASTRTTSFCGKLIQEYGNEPLPPISAAEARSKLQNAQKILSQWRPPGPTYRGDPMREFMYITDYIILARFLHGVLSPIRHLPVELLNQIFIYACTGPGGLLTRFTLTRVCRRWRSVAFETSQLWTYLRVDVVRASRSRLRVLGVDNINAYLQECIRRAKGRPITFEWKEELAESKKLNLDWITTTLYSLPPARYNSFTWTTPSHYRRRVPDLFDRVLGYLRSTSSTSLEFLSLSNFNPPARAQNFGECDPPFIDLTAFQRLTKLNLSLHIPIAGIGLRFQRSSCTFLHLETALQMWQRDTLTMLKDCVNLEVCILKSRHFERENPANLMPEVRLPRLTTLRLSCETDTMFLGVLPWMKTPVLTHLTIHLECDSRILAFNSYVPFFVQCRRLQNLWISGIASREDIFQVLAPTLPNLVELGIMVNGEFLDSTTRSRGIYEALDALRVGPNQPALFLNLRAFQLICEADQRIVYSFCKILESRRWHRFPHAPHLRHLPWGLLVITNNYIPSPHEVPSTLPLSVITKPVHEVRPHNVSLFLSGRAYLK